MNNVERQKDKTESGVSQIARLPRNIRQVGQIESDMRIYVEDYVMTYMKRVADGRENSVLILFGSTGPVEGINATFISGAVNATDDIFIESDTIKGEVWDKIYEEGGKYFEGLNIVGWAYVTSQYQEGDMFGFMMNRLLRIHKENFPGNDRVLMLYDGEAKEEEFYRFVSGELKKQRGHFIYYERNDNMQEYMISNNASPGMETGYNDEITKKIRMKTERDVVRSGVISEPDKKNEKNSIANVCYKAAMLAAVVLLFGAAAKVKGVDSQTIKDAINAGASKETSKENTSNGNGQKIDVEDVRGNIPEKKTETDADKSGESNNDSETKDGEAKADESKDDEKKDSETKNDENKDADTKTGEAESEEKTDDKKKDDEDTKNNIKEDNKNDENTKSASAYSTTYVVKEGDTLAGISIKLYGNIYKVESICKANNITDENMIHPGDKLTIPTE